MDTIYFYRANGKYGWLSNFYYASIVIQVASSPLVFMTSEHLFQWCKFTDEVYREKIYIARTPGEAAKLGRAHHESFRKDWEGLRDMIMREVLRLKFNQNPNLKERLLETGDAILVEHTERDTYWADGGNGSGKNKLGQLLMELRASYFLEEKK